MPHRDVRDARVIASSTADVVSVALDVPAVMQADGDLLGLVASARFSVVPGALTVNVATTRTRLNPTREEAITSSPVGNSLAG
jgi:diacylglycerol kinase family enzyme